jgi:HEAT repeat protein
LWLHQSHNVVIPQLLDQVLGSPDFRARAAAVRVLLAWRDRLPDPLAQLQELINDDHPRVRLEAVRALSFFHGEDAVKAAEIAVESLIHPQDPFLTFVLDETLKTLDRRIEAATR